MNEAIAILEDVINRLKDGNTIPTTIMAYCQESNTMAAIVALVALREQLEKVREILSDAEKEE